MNYTFLIEADKSARFNTIRQTEADKLISRF